MIQCCRKQKRKNQPIARSRVTLCYWFILPLLLATPTMQFSLDRKRRSHKQKQCSASDSVGLIFTRSYRSTLLITTPTTTPSLVKTSLYRLFPSSLVPLFQNESNCKTFHVIFQKRVRVFHRGFKHEKNWWKHEAAGRVLLLFSSVWNPDETRSTSFWNYFNKRKLV